MSDAPLFWNLARASGFVAYGLLAATMIFGLAVRTRALSRLVKPAAVTDTHRVLSLLALGMIALHGMALVLDPVVEISPAGLLLPGLTEYRPVWTAFGVVAAWLALAVHASFSLRKRIGARTWRRLHWLTYAVFLTATVHGIASGTDTTRGWAMAIYGLAVGAAVGATVWRVMGARAKTTRTGGEGSSTTPGPRPMSPPGGRLRPAALLAVALASVAAAGVLANVALLDAARPADVPVGEISPLAHTPDGTPPPAASPQPAPSQVTPQVSAPAGTTGREAIRTDRAGERQDRHREIRGADDDD